MKVEINDMDHMGNGIGKIGNKIVFVPKTVPFDVCEIGVVKDSKNYSIGKIDKIIKKSNLRIDSLCPYYGICGGCNISNLSYDDQLKFKEKKVINIFKKYLNMDIHPNVIPSNKQYGYRNKITYHVENNKIGLVSEFEGLLDIDNCLLVSDRINELCNEIKKENLLKVKKIIIKECDNGLILDIDGNIDINNFKEKCLVIYINGKVCYEKEKGYIKLGDLTYYVSNKSFFQINTSNIVNLYNEILKYGNFKANDMVIDLYSGVGSISLYIAKYVKKVLGIEIVAEAVNDANENAIINNISNVEFLCGDVSKLISDNIYGDVLIVDPPRTGLDKHTIGVINNQKIEKMIYASCNPMTLVRDIKMLDNYELKDISIVDMFPQTHHCESIVLLELK